MIYAGNTGWRRALFAAQRSPRHAWTHGLKPLPLAALPLHPRTKLHPIATASDSTDRQQQPSAADRPLALASAMASPRLWVALLAAGLLAATVVMHTCPMMRRRQGLSVPEPTPVPRDGEPVGVLGGCAGVDETQKLLCCRKRGDMRCKVAAAHHRQRRALCGVAQGG